MRETFDEFLRARSAENFLRFSDLDYYEFVNSNRRRDGVREFFAARNVRPP